MSFNIYASGLLGATSGGRKPFLYTKNNCLDRGDFDTPKLLEMIPQTPNMKGIAEKVGGTQEKYLTDSVINGATKGAEIEMAGMVCIAISELAMRNGGEISVYCINEDWLWGTTNSYVNFRFYEGGEPGRDFLKKINPGLVKTELNNFGVLRQIAIALSEYNKSLPGSASPYLNISLSR